MKKNILLSVILGFMASSAFAADDLVIICSPNEDSMNGLGFAWARFDISQENPEADMFYKYENTPRGDTRKAHYDYEGTETEYSLIPSTNRNAPNVYLKRVKKDVWEATFTDDMIDTLSVLPCSEGEPEAVQG